MNEYEAYTSALWYLNFAKISHHPRFDEFEAALKKAGIITWSLDDEVFKEYLLRYFGGEFREVFPDKTQEQLNSAVPLDVIRAYLPKVSELHAKQKLGIRLFTHDLVENFSSIQPLSNEDRVSIEGALQTKLPELVRTKATLSQIETEIRKIIAQTIPAAADSSVAQAIETVRPTAVDLMVTPRVFAQATTAAVVDKKNYVTILTQLIKETPAISVERHAIQAEALVRTLEATNATVVGADAARAGGQLLIALAQQSNKPLGVAVAALLNPQTRDRIFDALAARSWEQVVDNVTKKAAIIALDQNILQKIIENGNQCS